MVLTVQVYWSLGGWKRVRLRWISILLPPLLAALVIWGRQRGRGRDVQRGRKQVEEQE
jgi:hypothetical protein